MNYRDDPRLKKLEDTDYDISDNSEDIRGHTVLDQNGEEIGKVESIIIDTDNLKARFIEIKSDAFGGDDDKFLIPTDAVTAVLDDEIRIDQVRDQVVSAPRSGQSDDYEQSYAHYGKKPYWDKDYSSSGNPLDAYVVKPSGETHPVHDPNHPLAER